MRPNSDYLSQPLDFWAEVRLISQECGYKVWGKNAVVVPTPNDVASRYAGLGLSSGHLVSNDTWTDQGWRLHRYFAYRAELLQDDIAPLLMDLSQAQTLYTQQIQVCKPMRPPPMNKQKGSKKTPAYLTALVDMLIEHTLRENSIDPDLCDYDPRSLSVVTQENSPFRTLGRRFDGAFPSVINPIALWEVKEYYHTTTFGSRIADGVYVSILDGMELKELKDSSGTRIRKYLVIDAYDTWWGMGISYLCRIVDMMHMGYVDEVIFGREVVDRNPETCGRMDRCLQQADGKGHLLTPRMRTLQREDRLERDPVMSQQVLLRTRKTHHVSSSRSVTTSFSMVSPPNWNRLRWL